MNKISLPLSILSIHLLTHPLLSVYVFVSVCVIFGIELRAFHMLGKCPTTEPSPILLNVFVRR